MLSLVKETVERTQNAVYMHRRYQGLPEISKQIISFINSKDISFRLIDAEPQRIQHIAQSVGADAISAYLQIAPSSERGRYIRLSVTVTQNRRPNRDFAEISLDIIADEKNKDSSEVLFTMQQPSQQIAQNAKQYMQKLFSAAYKVFSAIKQQIQQELDQEIKLYEILREAEKNTDEVQPADSMDSDAVHGGQSNSAEVDNPAAVPNRKDEQNKQNMSQQKQHNQQQTANSPEAKQTDKMQNQKQDGQNTEDNKHTDQQGHKSQDNKMQKHSHGKDAEGKDEQKRNSGRKPASMKQLRKQAKAVKTDMKALRQFGGFFRDKHSRAVQAKKYAIRFNRILNRLAGETKEGPRWKYHKVAQKVLSFRMPKLQDRRLEAGRPAVLFLLDFSASMGSYVPQSDLMIQAAAQLGTEAKVIVVATSNGYPQELYVDGKKIKQFKTMPEKQIEKLYTDLIRQHQVRVAVCFADSDGDWIYEKIAEKVDRFYWLHNWACSSGKVKRDQPDRSWSKAARDHTVMYIGVGSVQQIIAALEDAIK